MNSQLQELFIAFGVTAVGMLMGLLVMRAGSHAFWRWPVYSAMTMVLGVVLWNLMQAHLFPPDWRFSHPRALYFSALGLYFLLGLALGLLLGGSPGVKRPGRTKRNPHELPAHRAARSAAAAERLNSLFGGIFTSPEIGIDTRTPGAAPAMLPRGFERGLGFRIPALHRE